MRAKLRSNPFLIGSCQSCTFHIHGTWVILKSCSSPSLFQGEVVGPQSLHICCLGTYAYWDRKADFHLTIYIKPYIPGCPTLDKGSGLALTLNNYLLITAVLHMETSSGSPSTCTTYSYKRISNLKVTDLPVARRSMFWLPPLWSLSNSNRIWTCITEIHGLVTSYRKEGVNEHAWGLCYVLRRTPFSHWEWGVRGSVDRWRAQQCPS